MAEHDLISDSTPRKRRKLDGEKGWDSQNDSGEDFTVEDFQTEPTMPLGATQKRQLQYTREQSRSDLSMTARPTQPTQSLNAITQPTLASERRTSPPTSDVLVDRSSPTATSPPQPIRNARFAKPGGFLASAMAPPGTAFRAPLGVQRKPTPVAIDDDDDDDAPVHHSSDEETQGFSSNLKPTNFKKGGNRLDSTPNRSDRVCKGVA